MTTQEKLDMCAALDMEIRQFINNWLDSMEASKTSGGDAVDVLLAVLVTTIAGVAAHSGTVNKQHLLNNMAEAFSIAERIASRNYEEVH
jgi:hypothetical protein